MRFWEPTIFLVSEVSAVRFGKEFTTGTPPVQKGCGQGCVGLAVVGKHSTLWGEKLCKRRGGKDKKNVRILLQETFQGGVFFRRKKYRHLYLATERYGLDAIILLGLFLEDGVPISKTKHIKAPCSSLDFDTHLEIKRSRLFRLRKKRTFWLEMVPGGLAWRA